MNIMNYTCTVYSTLSLSLSDTHPPNPIFSEGKYCWISRIKDKLHELNMILVPTHTKLSHKLYSSLPPPPTHTHTMHFWTGSLREGAGPPWGYRYSFWMADLSGLKHARTAPVSYYVEMELFYQMYSLKGSTPLALKLSNTSIIHVHIRMQ